MTVIQRTRAATEVPSAWRRIRWAHPELCFAGVALVAWYGVVVHHTLSAAVSTSPRRTDLPHQHGVAAIPAAEPVQMSEIHTMTMGFVESAVLWCVMVTAMMLPTVLPQARYIALNGKWRRRHRGPALFVIAYLAVWSAVGVIGYTATWSRRSDITGMWALSAVLAVAAGWEWTRWKRHFLRGCHRLRTIPPANPKADRACVTEGVRNGLYCVGACGPMMASMIVVPHHAAMWLMLGLTFAVGAEKQLTAGAQYIRWVAVGLAIAAVAVLGLAIAD